MNWHPSITVAVLLCSGVSTANPPVRTAAEGRQQDFAWKLYHQLAAKKGNVFLSPTSVSAAFALANAGARGETASEMAQAFGFPADPAAADAFAAKWLSELNSPAKADGFQLSVANALWGQQGYPFHREFLQRTEQSYGAGFRKVDFTRSDEARKTINEWVSGQTKGRIPELFGPGSLGHTTRLALTNAVYFHAEWTRPFPKSATRVEDFHAPGGDVKTSLMHDVRKMKYAETDDFQLVAIPYKGGAQMLVVLPKAGKPLSGIEATLSNKSLAKAANSMQERRVKLTFPKFRLDASYALEQVLPSLGVRKAFDRNAADFSGMCSHERLWINAVVHRAFIEVDERKTEAAAATGVGVKAKSRVSEDDELVEFRVDRPFVFVIQKSKSGVPLFIGRVEKPTAAKQPDSP